MNSKVILLLIAIIPVILLGFYIYKKDKEKEPLSLLLKLLFGGFLSCIAATIITMNLSIYFPLFTKDINVMSTIEILIYSFICIALIEEFSKYIYLYFIAYYNKEFNYTFDMIVYGVFSSLGFALIENVLYVFQNGYEIGLLRAITAIPIHACTGAFMGIYLSIAKQRELLKLDGIKKYKFLSVLIPTILHGMYDYCAFTNNLVIVITIVIMFSTVTIININAHNKIDRKIK